MALLSIQRPGVAIGFALCIYGIQQAFRAFSPWFAGHYVIINYTVAILLLITIVAQLLRLQFNTQDFPRACWAILALIMYAAVSVVLAPIPAFSIHVCLASLPTIVVFVLMMPLCYTEPKDLHHAIMTILILGACLLPATLMASWSGRALTFVTDRGVHIAGNPLAIAGVAGYVLVAVVLMNFQGIQRIWQVLRWGLVPLGLLVIMQSQSRGQFFGTLIAITAFLPVSRNIKRFLGFMAMIVGVAAVLGVGIWILQTYGDPRRWGWDAMRENYGFTRIDTSLTLLKAWAAGGPFRWIFGLGSSASYEIIGYYPHFVPLEVLAELGIIGFSLYCAVLYGCARAILRLLPLVRNYPEARGVLATLGGLVFLGFILSLKQGSLLGSSQWFGTIMLLGRFEMNVLRQNDQRHAPLQVSRSIVAA